MTIPFETDLGDLLDHLCVELGFCLPPEDSQRLIQDPPADAGSFVKEVFSAEGVDVSSARPDLFRQVLDLVEATYDHTFHSRPSSMRDLQESWHRTRAHLDRARAALGDPGSQLERFQEYLDHNELELALDELESLGDRTPVPDEYWRHLRSAADEMRLAEHYERLHRRMRSAEA